MATEYDRSYLPPFPRLAVAMSLPDSGLRSPSLWGLVDTGADITLVPRHQLQAVSSCRRRRRRSWLWHNPNKDEPDCVVECG